MRDKPEKSEILRSQLIHVASENDKRSRESGCYLLNGSINVVLQLLRAIQQLGLSHMLSTTALSYHFYADDTQLYISFNSPDSATSLATLSSALDSVHAWLTSNRLSVNPSKTEFLIIGTPQQRSKLTAATLTFQGTMLTPTDSTQSRFHFLTRTFRLRYTSPLSAKAPTFKYVNYAKFAHP